MMRNIVTTTVTVTASATVLRIEGDKSVSGSPHNEQLCGCWSG